MTFLTANLKLLRQIAGVTEADIVIHPLHPQSFVNARHTALFTLNFGRAVLANILDSVQTAPKEQSEHCLQCCR